MRGDDWHHVVVMYDHDTGMASAFFDGERGNHNRPSNPPANPGVNEGCCEFRPNDFKILQFFVVVVAIAIFCKTHNQ